ncbi:MAG: DNA gyrase inhibitor YacG [Planctomycetota bacterium]
MTALPEIQCPTCRKFFPADIKAPSMPFCSMRGTMVDLNHWFSEEVGLPVCTSDEPEDQEEPQAPSSPKEYRFD